MRIQNIEIGSILKKKKGLDQRIRFIAVREELLRKELEITLGECILIHRQERAIEIEQYRFDFHMIATNLCTDSIPVPSIDQAAQGRDFAHRRSQRRKSNPRR